MPRYLKDKTASKEIGLSELVPLKVVLPVEASKVIILVFLEAICSL